MGGAFEKRRCGEEVGVFHPPVSGSAASHFAAASEYEKPAETAIRRIGLSRFAVILV
jgi:hypothetical protein